MPRNHIKITPDIEASIRRCTLDGDTLVMPDPAVAKFDNWPAMKKVFDALGGKWNKKAQAVIFPSDAKALLLPAVEHGSVLNKKQHFQFFPTPRAIGKIIIDALLENCTSQEWYRVLEPSAGDGAICDAMECAIFNVTIDVCEIQDELREQLAKKDYKVIGSDFLALPPDPVYDMIAMNPPFQDGQDIAHCRHAWDFLNPGGSMVCILSASILTNQRKAAVDFRKWIAGYGGAIVSLPADAFKESGTGVSACYVVLRKPV
jgi:hypothetical protein